MVRSQRCCCHARESLGVSEVRGLNDVGVGVGRGLNDVAMGDTGVAGGQRGSNHVDTGRGSGPRIILSIDPL